MGCLECCLFALGFVLFGQAVKTELSFAGYYGSHMVLQQAPKRAIVWGYADGPGDVVSVTLTGFVTMETNTEFHSQLDRYVWRVLLPAVEDVSRSYTITASTGGTSAHLTDVLFGDVWLCSGQSNMQFPLNMVFNATAEIADARNYPDIRLQTIMTKYSNKEEYDAKIWGRWTSAAVKGGPMTRSLKVLKLQRRSISSIAYSGDPNDWTYFSAVCFLYGKYLYQELQYPIGLVATSEGGTVIESWSSAQANQECKSKQKPSNRGRLSDLPRNQPTRLWNAMIHPLLNMTIYGVIWYQGESNDHAPDLYRCQFPALISDWRRKFHLGSGNQTDPSFPFGFVQLGPRKHDDSIQTGFPDIRWAQTAYLGYPEMSDTFTAVAMDLADFESPYKPVHTRDKQTVARRLALSGLSVAYEKTVGQFQGPRVTSVAITKGQLLVHVIFDNGQSAIEIRNKLGFELCCSKNKNSECNEHDSDWIEGPIIKDDDNSVVIQMTGICQNQWIVGIRYAWRESPCSYKQCAIYSAENSLPMGTYKYIGLIGRFEQ